MKFLRPIILVNAFVCLLVAAMTLAPLVLASVDGEGWQTEGAFVWVLFLGIAFAASAYGLAREHEIGVSSKQLYLITASSWGVLALGGALPLYLALPGLSFADAFFESMSGITTTGSTVLVGLDNMPRSILLWRALLQWVGGIGIIVLSIAVLPFLRVGGMRLFATESSDWSGKSLPRTQVLIRNIGVIYIALSLLSVLAYQLSGMGLFDAVVHAMTTLSTGGYSNYDASLGHFHDNRFVLWTGTVFMLLGSLPFLLYVHALRGKSGVLLRDTQVRGFLAFVVFIVLFLTVERALNAKVSFDEALTQVAFNVVSVISTTGYASEDYTLWGHWANVGFFYLMFLGGCSGSTAGSIKFFRFQVAVVMLRHQLKIMHHPHGTFISKYNGRLVSGDIIRSIIAFSFFFAFTVAVLALLLSLTGLDFVTSISAATTAVANVGPGLGQIVGPVGNFAPLTDGAKWLLSGGMLLGRLEIMTVLVLLTPSFWRT